ncbi:MAG: molecular chaperone DnaJ [Spirochaetales bacterium]
MAKRDYYEVLGLSKGASMDDIKKAYRKLAVKHHPDRNPGDQKSEELFKEATEAYEVLADENRRRAYDQFGFAGVDGASAGGGGGGPQGFSDFEDIFSDFSDIFGSFFGGGSRRGGRSSGRTSARRGSDLRYDLEISFEDAAFGTEVEIEFDRQATCGACGGTGAEDGASRRTCETCGGVGQVRRSSGFFSIATVCPTCNGEGQIIENPCKVCGGTGVERQHRKLSVKIPAGIDSGKRINIPGEGDAGASGGPPGDLYVFVRVREHEYFERDGYDVYCLIPISITQAALGGEVNVPTLGGRRVKVRVPSGTQTGKVLRLKGEGIPHLNSSRRGDMYVKIQVRVPEKLNHKAKNLLKELAEVQGEESDPDPVRLSRL